MPGSGTPTAGDLYRAGRLNEAIAAANAAVRAEPTELGPRILLAEFLLFEGNFERADVILDAARDIDPEASLVVAEFRQLLRAEMARRQLRRDGRMPEFLDEPTPALQAVLAARVALRAGDTEAAARYAADAESLRPRVAGRHGDVAFEDFRDACDLHTGYWEILTSTGKYFWLPTELIERIEFHAPVRSRDLYWRRAKVSVRSGPDGDVYIPAIYGADDARELGLQLGRATDWVDYPGLVIGVGQRLILAGEEALAMQSMTRLEFDV